MKKQEREVQRLPVIKQMTGRLRSEDQKFKPSLSNLMSWQNSISKKFLSNIFNKLRR